VLCATPRNRGDCDERRQHGEATSTSHQADPDSVDGARESEPADPTTGEVVGHEREEAELPAARQRLQPGAAEHHPPPAGVDEAEGEEATSLLEPAGAEELRAEWRWPSSVQAAVVRMTGVATVLSAVVSGSEHAARRISVG
jgi:hypothetical protein